MSSAIKVARRLGLTDFGICFELEVGRLHELAQASSEAVAHHLQRSSSFAAKKQSTSRGGKLLSPDQILGGKRTGAILERGRRFTYLDGTALSIGGSQEQIGKFQGRCESTIQRRLSNSRRAARGQPQLDRTQVAIARVSFGATMRIVQDDEPGAKLFRPSWSRSLCFEAMANVYDFGDQVLVSKRRLRRKLQKAITAERIISKSKDPSATRTEGEKYKLI